MHENDAIEVREVKVEMEVKDEDEFEDALEPEGREERDLRTEEMTRSATSPRPVARARLRVPRRG